MAIVPDLAGPSFNLSNQGRATDRHLSAPNRWVATPPYGVLTPGYTGEMVQDTSTGQVWLASNMLTTGWIAVTVVV